MRTYVSPLSRLVVTSGNLITTNTSFAKVAKEPDTEYFA